MFSDDDGRISEKTGIKKLNRSQYSAFELAISALKKSKMLANIASEIQYVIYVTQSPTNFLPNHASEIQDYFSINRNSMCFDINQGCSGFVQALFLAIKLLNNKSQKLDF